VRLHISQPKFDAVQDSPWPTGGQHRAAESELQRLGKGIEVALQRRPGAWGSPEKRRDIDCRVQQALEFQQQKWRLNET
jgi:hypothetical protein